MPKSTDISKFAIACIFLLAAQVADATTCVSGKSFKVRRVCGVVTDRQGAVIPNARIEIDTFDSDTLQTKTKVAETTSGPDGRLSISKVEAGKYMLRADVRPFVKVAQPFVVTSPSIKSAGCREAIEIVLDVAGRCSAVKNAFKNWK